MTFVCIAIVWLIGFGLARFLFPAPARWSLHTVFLFSLGTGLGIGIASCLYFMCLAIAGPNPWVLAGSGAIAAAAALMLGLRAKGAGTVLSWATGPPTPAYLDWAFLLAIALAVSTFVVYSAEKPQGEWDAWSVWNLKARFLFRGGDSWRDVFSSHIANSYPGYPLLIPSMVAMCWTLARGESTSAPIAVAFLFSLGVSGLLIASVGILRGKTQAFVAGILLLATSSFVQLGAMQYADVPLSFFMLAALALVCLQDRFPEELRFSLAAGFIAGLAAWTKDEGWLFLAAILPARLVAILHFGNRAALGLQFLRLAAGALPPVALAAFFKVSLAPRNPFLAQNFSDLMAHVATFGRWMITVEGFVKILFVLGGFLLPMVVVLALYWFLVRFQVEEPDRSPLATVVLTLSLMLAGELAAYVIFPPDIVTELNASLERVIMQLWPAAVLAFFLAAKPPQLVGEPARAGAKAAPVARSFKPKGRVAQKPADRPMRLN